MANEQIKFNQLSKKDTLTTADLLAISNANGDVFNGNLQDLQTFLNTIGVSGYRSLIMASDIAPTEDGIYLCGDSGTYTNFGGTVVNLTNGITFISVEDTQSVFKESVINAPYTTTDSIVDAEFLDFTNGLVTFPSTNNLYPNSSFAVEIFLNLRDITAVTGVIIPSAVGSFQIITNAGNLAIAASGQYTTINIPAASFLNEDKHLIVSFDGTNHKVYVDGIDTAFSFQDSRVYTGGVTGLKLGAVAISSLPMNGKINLLRIWSREIENPEAITLYNEAKPYNLRLKKDADITFELLANNSNNVECYDTSNFKSRGVITGAVTSSGIMPSLQDAEAVLSFLDILPSNIYIAIGRELNIWFDSILPYYDKEDKFLEFECSEGKTMARSFRFTPTTTGVHSATVTIRNAKNETLETKTISINAVAKDNGAGINQLLFIGDSTTDSYLTDYLPGTGRTEAEMLHEVSDLIIADGGFTPLFMGLRGVSPYKHQAHSGYSSDLFISNNPSYPNPFWDSSNSRNDFQKYMSDNSNFGGTNTIDFVFIQLGINDLKNGGVAATVISRLDTLIADILHSTRGYPSAKIIISATPYVGADATGWGLNFFADSSYLDFVEALNDLAVKVIANYHENASNPQLYVAPNFLFTDRKYGYPRALTNVSDRDSIQEFQYTDSVHPNESGYKQAADSYYSRLRSLL